VPSTKRRSFARARTRVIAPALPGLPRSPRGGPIRHVAVGALQRHKGAHLFLQSPADWLAEYPLQRSEAAKSVETAPENLTCDGGWYRPALSPPAARGPGDLALLRSPRKVTAALDECLPPACRRWPRPRRPRRAFAPRTAATRPRAARRSGGATRVGDGRRAGVVSGALATKHASGFGPCAR
jgi:hypothetical protein